MTHSNSCVVYHVTETSLGSNWEGQGSAAFEFKSSVFNLFNTQGSLSFSFKTARKSKWKPVSCWGKELQSWPSWETSVQQRDKPGGSRSHERQPGAGRQLTVSQFAWQFAQNSRHHPTNSKGQFHWSSPSEKELIYGIYTAGSYICIHQNGCGNPDRAHKKICSHSGLRLQDVPKTH